MAKVIEKSKKLCILCAQEILTEAVKCEKCGGFQNWRRHQPLVTLSIAVVALFIALVNFTSDSVHSPNSSLGISHFYYEKGKLNSTVYNTGDRAGVIVNFNFERLTRDVAMSIRLQPDKYYREPGTDQSEIPVIFTDVINAQKENDTSTFYELGFNDTVKMTMNVIDFDQEVRKISFEIPKRVIITEMQRQSDACGPNDGNSSKIEGVSGSDADGTETVYWRTYDTSADGPRDSIDHFCQGLAEVLRRNFLREKGSSN